MKLLVFGGRQRGPINLGRMREWRLYDQARIVELDTETGATRVRLEYTSDPELVPAQAPAHVFKAASLHGDRILAPTQTEVLELDRATLSLRRRVTHRLFNDLHHAAWLEGRLHVVCTGLDRLLVFEEGSEPAAVRGAVPPEELDAIDPTVDYRRVPTTKPHRAHPNFVFRTAEGVWLTRFEQRDALCLDRPELRLPIDVGRPHDGIVTDERVWFTTVNGHLVSFPLHGPRIRHHLDLNDGHCEAPLGWCRGLYLHGDVAYVGFSRIRYTRLRRNLSWVRKGFQAGAGYTDRPTRVAAYDLATGTLRAEWDLEPCGLNAVFTLLPAGC